MRIPVPDKYFEFAVCTQTLEDLRCPNFLMDELSRVAKAGYVEVPSRLAEQTVGMSDRASTFQGYNHHKWIIDFEGQLVFYDKDESLYGPRSLHSVPRRSFEAIVAADSHRQNVEYCWVDRISYRICEAGDAARDKAFAFRASLGISGIDVALDNAIRFSRRVRDTAIGRDPWKSASMRLLSQQYSTLDLS
ncbi:MAG: hypothetical protein PS018_04875 [bacterium]|nr:hypothetical protein [bacterium]